MPPPSRSEDVREYAVPLGTTAPTVPFDRSELDLAPLAQSAVVGLGEATHGTREFFRLKDRVIRALVERCGFRTIAIEAPVAGTMPADPYVFDGRGTAEGSLAEMNRWQWGTEAIRDLLEWVRSFNEGRPPTDRVRVRGIDLSTPSATAERLQSVLRKFDPHLAESDAMTALTSLEVSADGASRRRRLDDALTRCAAIAGRLTEGGPPDDDPGSVESWRTARHLCRVVERNCEWHRVRHEHDGPHPAGMATRDRLMAENVAWAAERDRGEGVVVWAHNSHVQRGTFDDGQDWTDEEAMGEHLRRGFGDRYVPLGFDFGRGSFRALGGEGSDVDGVGTFTAKGPIDGSATEPFDAMAVSPSFLELASASDDANLEPWFARPQAIRRIGSVYSPSAPSEERYQRTILPESFDGVVYVRESTPSVPLA